MISDDDNIEYIGGNFVDISDGKTYTEAVGKAKQLKIAEGDTDDKFYPENEIKVYELMQVVENVLALKDARINFDFTTFTKLTDDKISKEQEAFVLRKLYEALEK